MRTFATTESDSSLNEVFLNDVNNLVSILRRNRTHIMNMSWIKLFILRIT